MGESDRTEHLVTARLFLADPEITARETHDAWVARKQKASWSLAERYDAEARQHPQLVPFDALAEAQKRAEEAGVQAMRDALPHARENRLPPDLEFEMMRRIAVSNANAYASGYRGRAPD